MIRVRRAWAGILLCAVIVVWPAVVRPPRTRCRPPAIFTRPRPTKTRLRRSIASRGGVRVDDARAIDQYRAFCLLALGKATEAAQAIESVVAAQPSYASV